MTAVPRSAVKIWVVPAATAPSLLVRTSAWNSTNTLGYIAGEIKTYGRTGGEKDVESDPVFGGFVDKEKPQSQFEIPFEIVPSLERAELWDSMIYGVDPAGVLTSVSDSVTDRAVFYEGFKTATGAFAYGFDNCSVTSLDIDHSADDNLTKNMTLKFSPTTDSGRANLMFNSASRDETFADVSDLPNWTDLDNA